MAEKGTRSIYDGKNEKKQFWHTG